MIQATVFCILSGCAGAIIGSVLALAGMWWWDRGEPIDVGDELDVDAFNAAARIKHKDSNNDEV